MGIGIVELGFILFAVWAFYTALIELFTYGWFRAEVSLKIKNQVPGMKVSVIIAAKNEEKKIADVLGDLLIQDYPSALLEVIVVDDHSTDATAGITGSFIAENRISGFMLIRSEEKTGFGKKNALTQAVSRSAGDVIITTDADCHVGPGWVSSLAAQFQDEKIMMVFGPVAFFDTGGLVNRFQSLEFSGLMASGAGAAGAGHPFMCSGACLAYRKRAFMQVSGYKGNEKYISGDDVFLLHKMKREYGRGAILFNKDKESLVKTIPAPDLKKFISQRVRWASKSKGYNDHLSITTAIIVFSYSIAVLSFFIAGFSDPEFFLASGGLLVMKMITDFPLMLGITGFNGQRRLMWWYMPFQVVYPFYIVVTGVCSLFKRREW